MFARIETGVVVELLNMDDLSGKFTSAIIAQCEECDETTEVGWTWDGSTFTPPAGPSTEELAAARRAERDRRLTATDWTQLPDAPLVSAQVAEWQVYRERLRDVPEQSGFPDAVEWPVKPE